jgi:DNA-binding LytR/AlgR family response regulator
LQQNFLFVKCNQAWVKVQYAEILFIEGLENYVRIHCNEKVIITLTTMKNIEEMLPAPSFLRIHRSYIVNLQHVDSIQNNVVSIKNKNLLVGKSYKKNVAEILRSNSTK